MNPQRFKTKDAQQCVGNLNEKIRQARVIRAFAPIREAARIRQLVCSAREWLYLAMMYDSMGSEQFDTWRNAYHRRAVRFQNTKSEV